MNPVDQKFLHDPDNGIYGDCQRAVIAFLLELALDDVPHFFAESDGYPNRYWEIIQSFCRGHGFIYLTMPADQEINFWGDHGDVYHEISGPSPRQNGTYHAVVGKNGDIFFDPDPSRAGLAGTIKDWTVAYLIKA